MEFESPGGFYSHYKQFKNFTIMAKKIFYTLVLALLAPFCFPINVMRTSYEWGVLPFRYGTGSPFMFNLRVFASAFARVWKY